MQVTVLASGSRGNAVLVEGGGSALLIDAGVPPAELQRRLERVGHPLALGSLVGALLTHEHLDHVCGAAALQGRGVPLYATRGTARSARLDAVQRVEAGKPLTLGGLVVVPVASLHDAIEPVGYVVEGDGLRFGLLTDCGYPAAHLVEPLRSCDLLLLEANHDPELLAHGRYPQQLKRRIAGPRGHLSNAQAGELLRQLEPERLQALILGHISEHNNRTELALATLREALGPTLAHLPIHLAVQGAPLPTVVVTPREPPRLSGQLQLAL
jgi:phosphoribosyl 1,2-cyclic phosphodiesterase